MLSYRQSLTKIGYQSNDYVSYLAFYSKPRSLRQAIRSMSAPATKDWSVAYSVYRDDESWIDELQGIACDGVNWIFSCNAAQKKLDALDKSIYTFPIGSQLHDDEWSSRVVYFQDVDYPLSRTEENDWHWGQLCCYQDNVYVSFFWEKEGPLQKQGSVVVFKNINGHLTFTNWIELQKKPVLHPVTGQPHNVEFQAINPWDGMFYTSIDDEDWHWAIHDPSTGEWTGKYFKLGYPANKVQGACFSPNGHLYISTNDTHPDFPFCHMIFYYSALNGCFMGMIPVIAPPFDGDPELEGICYSDLSFDNGGRAQIHAVMLMNQWNNVVEGVIDTITGGSDDIDNCYFIGYSSKNPEIA